MDPPTIEIETAIPMMDLTDEECGVSPSKATKEDLEAVDKTIRRSGIWMGVIIGIFIKFSALGARFIFSSMQPLKQSLILSLAWSGLTSAMGVGVLFALESLVANAKTNLLMDQWRSSIELSFAMGSISSMCVAWSVADFFLGVEGHFLESVGIWAFAILWAKMGLAFSQSSMADKEDGDMNIPLIKNEEEEEENSQRAFPAVISGLMVGCFIQFSSLGANFLLQSTHGKDIVNENGELNRGVILFSIVWSALTCLMGLMVLILMNRVLRAVETVQSIEKLFSLGAIIGVNGCWILTDLLCGHALVPNWWHWILLNAGALSAAIV